MNHPSAPGLDIKLSQYTSSQDPNPPPLTLRYSHRKALDRGRVSQPLLRALEPDWLLVHLHRDLERRCRSHTSHKPTDEHAPQSSQRLTECLASYLLMPGSARRAGPVSPPYESRSAFFTTGQGLVWDVLQEPHAVDNLIFLLICKHQPRTHLCFLQMGEAHRMVYISFVHWTGQPLLRAVAQSRNACRSHSMVFELPVMQ